MQDTVKTLEIRFNEALVERFARASGDTNPLHLSASYARRTPYGARIAHGVLCALAALGCSSERSGRRLGRLELRFVNPVFLDRSYEVVIEDDSPEALTLSIVDGRRQLLGLAARFSAGERAQPPGDAEPVGWRAGPAELGIDAIHQGQALDGAYAPRWAELLALWEQLRLGERGVDAQQAAALAWTSYLVGMELPGRRSLFSRLEAELETSAVTGDAALRYRAEVKSVEPQFGLVQLRAAVSTSAGVMARMSLSAFVRPEAPPVSVAAMARLLPDSRALTGKVALVIGGSRGLGAALVHALSRQGCTVYFGYLQSRNEAEAVAASLGGESAGVRPIQGDGGDPAWCHRTRAEILERHGRLDFLICSACLPIQPLWLEPGPGARVAGYVEQSLALVEAPLSCFLALVGRHGGWAVVLSSAAVRSPLAEWPHYVSAKCAVEGLTRTAALQYPDVGFLVARPPRLRTDLTQTTLAREEPLEPEVVAASIVRRLFGERPRGEMVVLEEFAPAGAPAAAAPVDVEGRGEAEASGRGRPPPSPGRARTLAIAATFTAEPLRQSLEFWSEELGLELAVQFGPYNQLFQELLAPSSLFHGNAGGVNLALIRVEDWLRYGDHEDEGARRALDRPLAELEEKLGQTVEELIAALRDHTSRGAPPLLVLLCPPSPALLIRDGHAALLREMEALLERGVQGIAGVHLVRASSYAHAYPLANYHDETRDEMGHIPYTPRYFSVLGTLVARMLHSLVAPPSKVLVLDCDNTLWKGVCGEDGPGGVEIGPAFRALQEAAIQQQSQGMLLCLCSKNVEEDVIKVFAERRDMPLTLDHITAHRINWQPKSENLRSLARELNLGLDSFVFIDDNPVEVAEVEAACPEVLALCLPKEPARIPAFLEHVWAFDRLLVTEEDRTRTLLYRQNRERQALERSSSSFHEFIERLNLDVRIAEVGPAELPRAAQLTQRTNQFNFSTIRRSEAELRALLEAGTHRCWVTHVSDRFGEHGLVGVTIAHREADRLVVDTFLLSCRVLGRGVEHAMLAHLGGLAQAEGLPLVDAIYLATAKNQPALGFLEAVGAACRYTEGERVVFRLPSSYAASIVFAPRAADDGRVADHDEGGTREKASKAPAGAVPRARLARIASELSEAQAIHDRIRARATRSAVEADQEAGAERAGAADAAPAAPVTPPEAGTPADEDALLRAAVALLVDVFARHLALPRRRLTPDAPFDSLGLTSFAIIEITVSLEEELGAVPKTLLFEHKTLGSLARYLLAEHRAELERKLGRASPRAVPAELPAPARPVGPRAEPAARVAPSLALPRRPRDIAVVGIAGRYPGARSPQELWENLRDGKSCVSEIPRDRWDHRRHYDPSGQRRDKSYTKWGGFVEGVDRFDSLFFSISPRDAELMDPQQRIFLEVAYEAVEDAGYTRSTLGRDVGVYVGVMANNYQLFSAAAALTGQSPHAYAENYQVANRVSYFFDLNGPSLSVDTACSASGVALHLACEAIRTGACSAAIAGGVNLILHPYRHVQYSQMNMLSRDALCRAFGQDAQGFVMGEGAGAALLKPLEQAERDGDTIHAVIKGSWVNSGGRTSAFTVPSPGAQAALVRKALEMAAIDPRSVSYIEAHGTGTPLGDPIEIRGLTTAFRASTGDKQFCAVGSLKPNIGHLEPAAAIAGLTKILAQLRHGQIAPSLNAGSLNPYIDFEGSPFYVQRALGEWKRPRVAEGEATVEAPRRAGLSSFGAGGVNAHLVLEEYRGQDTPAEASGAGPELIVLSARNKERLRAYVERLHSFLGRDREAGPSLSPALGDIAYTLQIGREAMDERIAVIAQDKGDLRDKLRRVLEGELDVADVFTGNTKATGGLSDLLAEGEEALGFLRALVKGGHLVKLARFWVQGVELPWAPLHAGRARRRVSLPTYPFAEIRHWLPEATQVVETSAAAEVSDARQHAHPLLDRTVTMLGDVRFAKRLDGASFYLRDHVVGRRKILPGVVYLEMARAAAAAARPGVAVRAIRSAVWTRPIAVEEAPIEVVITLRPAGGGVDAVVTTSPAGAPEVVHAQMRLAYEDQATLVRSAPEDVAAIRARCDRLMRREEIYERLASQAFHYGPAFQVIQEHLSGQGEALSRLAMTADVEGNADAFGLHPSLLDGALQTAIASLDSGATYLPFTLGELALFSAPGRQCYVHVRFDRVDDQMVVCHLRLLDEAGQIAVELRELTLRVQRSRAPVSEPVVHTYHPRWDRAALPAAERVPQGTTLLVLDSDDACFTAFGRALLEERSIDPSRSFLALPGTSFAAESDRRYRVRPDVERDYVELLEAIGARGPLVVLHGWGRRSPVPSDGSGAIEAEIARAVEMRLSSVAQVVRALLRSGRAEDVQVLSLCGDAQEDPFGAAVAGFARAMSHETTRIRFKTLHLAGAAPPGPATLLREIDRERLVEVRYDGEERWVRRVVPAPPQRPRGSDVALRRHGVYLITGGAGGLGLIFARHLAARVAATVVLTGRSELGEAQRGAIGEIEALGARCVYLQGDVTRTADMERVVAQVRAQLGGLHGVIHAAGVVEDATLIHKSMASFERVLAPKVLGTWVLDQVTAGEPLDFFLLCSSTASLLGSAGQADYAAANRFLDAFAERRAALVEGGRRNGRTLSVNWPYWAEGGMRVGRELVELTAKTTGMQPLPTAAGLLAFEDALCAGVPQVAVMTGDPRAFERALDAGHAERGDAPPPAAPRPPRAAGRPGLETQELSARLSAFVVAKASALLKVRAEDFDIEDDMSDYGFDSIALTELANAINGTFELSLTPVVFFENPSIGGLVRSLLSRHRDAFAARFERDRDAAAEGDPAAPATKGGTARPAPHRVEPGDVGETGSAPSGPPRAPVAATDASVGPEARPAAPAPPPVPAAIDRPAAAPAPSALEPIAIVGVAGRFPGAATLERFWEHLVSGRDLVREMPAERRSRHGFREEAGAAPGTRGGFIDDVDAFDALFFKISPREASLMDPQQRLFLEVAWHAIEDAGYAPSSLAGSRTGVFVGVTLHDYLELILRSGAEVVPHTSTGNVHSVVPNRLSYLLDLHGPSEPIDTACSSALVAVHRAVSAIRSGDCDMAIVGGVNVLLSPTMFASFDKAGMLAADGRCKTFDRSADGYVRGEGAGAIVVKPLRKALEDGDFVYSVIKGSAVNHGGRANSLTAPNPRAQADLLVTAYERAGVPPETVSYIEAHGTGTALGDPIEIEALKQGFSRLFEQRGARPAPGGTCGLGTVKTNIGHLESAAGMAGLIKVLLAMKHRILPPTLHFQALNPYIDLSGSPFYIVTEAQPWEPTVDSDGAPAPRRAGISSFGFGGANAHVILEEHVTPLPGRAEDTPEIVVLSARDEERLREYAGALRDFLGSGRGGHAGAPPTLSEVAHVLQVGRDAMEARLSFVARSCAEASALLGAYLDGAAPEAVVTGRAADRRAAALSFGQDDDDQAYLAVLIEGGRLAKLAALWARGAEVDWTALHRGKPRRRVPIPTYPFARQRHWFAAEVSPPLPEPTVRATSAEPTDAARAPVPRAKLPAPSTGGAPSTGVDRVLIEKRWSPAPLALPSPGAAPQTWLLVLGTEGAIEVLKELGSQPHVRWIVIRGHSALPKITRWEYEIDLDDPTDGARRISEILAEHAPIDGLLDLADIHAEPKEAPSGDGARIAILQGLLRHDSRAPLRILHVTRGLVPFENDRPTLAGARMAGLVRMLGAEHTRARAATIDVDLGIEAAEALLDIAIREASTDAAVGEICYRRGTRHLPRLHEIPAGAVAPSRLGANTLGPFRVDAERVYVITGGTGGLGFEAAKALVHKGARRLALLGATPLPERERWPGLLASPDVEPALVQRVRRVSELEALGAEVALFQGALVERERLAGFFDVLRRRLGPIAGVLHCAGVVSHRTPSFVDKDIASMRRVWEPKIEGLMVLHDLVRHDEPEFFVLYGSVSALVPALGVGLSDYASANAFLDAFAAYHEPRGRTRYLAVDWPSWRDTGMGAVNHPRYTGLGFTAHGTEDGLALLEAALHHRGATSVFAGVIDRSRFDPSRLLLVRPDGAPAREVTAKSAAATPAGGPGEHAATRALLLALFSRELMIDAATIRGEVNFGDYGVDSIVIAGLVTKMEVLTGEAVEPSVILENPTLDSLSRFLGETYGDGIRAYLARQGTSLTNGVASAPRGASGAGAPGEPPAAPPRSSLSNGAAHPHGPEASQGAGETAARGTGAGREATAASLDVRAIAVVGVACRFPGAESKEAFWDNLRLGRSSITEVPRARWDAEALYRPAYEQGKSISKWGGFVEGIELFDPVHFEIPAEDAREIDPLTRVFLECSEQALRDAGHERADLWGRRVGVFVGSGTSNYASRIQEPTRSTAASVNQNFIAAHVAHFFNLRGPNLVVDTACSSSLTSVHLACQSLLSGECEAALAGGVDLLLDEIPYLKLSAAKALSPDGRCRTFDVKANGFVPGEGAGAVLLKPLARALADGDRIYAILEATAVNNDGHTMGLTTPNMQAQELVVQEALDKAGVEAKTVSYIEAHGTATMIGDPIELKGLTSVFRRSTDEVQFCAVGSVKTNIGHLLLASGIAGLIKTVLSLSHRSIPPTRHCDEPNPRFSFKTSPFFPSTELRPWAPRHGVRRAGVSAFGFGGTNAHVLLRDFEPAEASGYEARRRPLPPVPYRKVRCWIDNPARVETRREPPARPDGEVKRGLLVLESA
ncbi:SDR family NAD(P)-dependent oxidoreductase [Sorangium sp. So ce362]|uniref:SDR family NAD(P)-dependent oxidoreductase n=1 Tax=Sorangium sp. So ce362 TaxID=3133303 RepID=UPI003F62B8E5